MAETAKIVFELKESGGGKSKAAPGGAKGAASAGVARGGAAAVAGGGGAVTQGVTEGLVSSGTRGLAGRLGLGKQAAALGVGSGGAASTGAAASGAGGAAAAGGGAMGAAAAVAVPLAIVAGLAIVAKKVVDAFKALDQRARRLAESLAKSGGALAASQANIEVQRTLSDLRRAERLGAAGVGKFAEARSKLDIAFEEFKDALMVPFIQAATPVIEMLADFMTEVSKHQEAIGGVVKVAGAVTFPIIAAQLKVLEAIRAWLPGAGKDAQELNPADPVNLFAQIVEDIGAPVNAVPVGAAAVNGAAAPAGAAPAGPPAGAGGFDGVMTVGSSTRHAPPSGNGLSPADYARQFGI